MEDLHHRMDDFLLGNLSDTERQAFQKRLNTEPDLKAAFEEHQKLFVALRKNFIRNELRDIHNKKQQTERKLKHNYIIWGMAASLVLLVGIGWLLQPSANQKLYKTYFYTDAGLPVKMGLSNNISFGEAMNQYKLGNYDVARTDFENLYKTNPDNDTLSYYIGMCFLNKDNIQAAQKELINIPTESAFYADATYFLGLIALKNDEVEKAKTYFQASKNPKAKEILKEIEK